MTITSTSRSADIRGRLDHPVVDVDGHILEYMPLVADYIREEGGSGLSDRIASSGSYSVFGARTPSGPGWYELSRRERRDRRLTRPPFWGTPTKLTLDAATSRLPRLLRSRTEEIGLDFAVLYPTLGLRFGSLADTEPRQVACRAFNRYLWDVYSPYADVMTPAAVIPLHTPEEGIAELEFAVETLGFKAVVLPSHVRRPIPAAARIDAEHARDATYIDKLGLDSEYDYDPVWRKCLELRVSPTFHSGSQDWDSRNSPSNYMYNHIGHFAASSEALCKALFFGGVTRRFPRLPFGFLETGVGWAVNLYADLVGHWEKRGGAHMSNYDPAALDHELFQRLVRDHGDPRLLAKVEELAGAGFFEPDREEPSDIDEFAAAGLQRAEDVRDRFVPNFFFGCEADDPINATVFNQKVNPFGARLNAVFSSDIGHWDVPDMRGVLGEAYELVEHEVVTETDFRDFVFTNPVKLHTRLNKDFFTGTVVEAGVAEVVSR